MGKDASYILARAKAQLAGKPAPVNPRIIQHLSPPVLPKGELPLANILAQDLFVPKTEWEWAQENSDSSVKAYNLKGIIKRVEKLSELTPTQLAPAKPKPAPSNRYTGTPQERVALGHIRIKQAQSRKLTKAEQKLLYRFRRAEILAKYKAKG